MSGGQRVKAKFDLVNDGPFSNAPAEGVLVRLGTMGEIARVRRHTEANLPIYLVEFGKKNWSSAASKEKSA
ncbi:nitrogen fixation protein NifZ [Bradyrhizobium sp. CIAT3101]|uniref:nitrogen fixation protein NifZ n=1 Tax=Bradyrhizobium sp. CIAT3101 TaxID=439387 RepID=UPI0024B09417|nr:nitrogen fixation protein NifZ [Bradyrhizobium sp. CIAT3101]WFU85622.1 nitrogen fixation protein NifZ [Bradyrhizobium sp. CIAT3101]